MCVSTEGEAVDHWEKASGDVYKTADLAYRNAGGEIVVLGRKDRLVNVSGQLVSLMEVAAVIAEHPDVADVEVIGVEGSESTAVIAWCLSPAHSGERSSSTTSSATSRRSLVVSPGPEPSCSSSPSQPNSIASVAGRRWPESVPTPQPESAAFPGMNSSRRGRASKLLRLSDAPPHCMNSADAEPRSVISPHLDEALVLGIRGVDGRVRYASRGGASPGSASRTWPAGPGQQTRVLAYAVVWLVVWPAG
jgi:hypothetical protein